MHTMHLIGGGWRPEATPGLYGPFLASAGPDPTVATVVLDEGDGPAQADRWARVLRSAAACTPVPVLVPLGSRLDVAALGDADAILVCGGLTPAYDAALAPAAQALRTWLDEGDRPYAGFSAGAAVAAARAVVGGWRSAGVEMCPQDASEDLDEISLCDGLGLMPWTVDVHAAQWGTLPRLVHAVGLLGDGAAGIALDEDTAVHVGPAGQDGSGGAVVAGLGRVHVVRAVPGGALVEVRQAGDRLVP